MKYSLLLVSVFLFVINPLLKSQDVDIIDKWWNEEKTSYIRIFKATNGMYYGKIEFLKNNPDKLDINNPDPAKRQEPVLGLMILKGFTYNTEKKQWIGGTIYDPNNGKTYDCYMWTGHNKDELFIKGYVLGMKFVGRETKWSRVKE